MPYNLDTNGDGIINQDDLFLYTAWFQAGDLAADFDGDGFVTGEDYDAYVAAFELAAGHSSDAYTDTTPASGSIVWHVSHTGSDSGLGTESSPLKSPRLAISRLRNLSADQVRLARGSTFTGGLGQCKAGGAGVGRNIVISSYGTGARPVVLCPDSGGIEFTGGGGSPSIISNVVISGIDFRADGRSPASQGGGIVFIRGGENLSIEDCSVVGFKDGVLIQGPLGAPYRNVRLYRVAVADSHGLENVGHSQGVYVDNVDGLVVDECVIDHNGWNEAVAGAGATIFNHNFYLTGGVTNVTIRNTITARASSHGLSANHAATFENNLCFRNPYHFIRVEGGAVTNNVFLESGDIGTAERGNGLVVGKVYASGTEATPCAVTGNIFSGKTAKGQNPAIQIGAGPVLVRENIVDAWPGGNVLLDPPDVRGVLQIANQYENPAWHRKTLDDYAKSIGLADAGAFLAAARSNSRDGWNNKLTATAGNAFIRSGYGR